MVTRVVLKPATQLSFFQYLWLVTHTRIEQPVTVPTLPTVSANVTTTGVASRAPAAKRDASVLRPLRLMMHEYKPRRAGGALNL